MEIILDIISEHPSSETPFYILDLETLALKVEEWNVLFPKIKPFYAVKCNSNEVLLRFLSRAGVNFDCASQTEMQMVLDMEVSPERIIYANPCKQISHLEFARDQGINLMTADSIDEISKIRSIHPSAEVIIRIAVDDSMSACRFNKKFGAVSEEWFDIISHARNIGLKLVGVSFHVGSGCKCAKVYRDAVRIARLFHEMCGIAGFKLRYLDVGGGFPGTGRVIEEISDQLRSGIEDFFPDDITIIAEPGRYFASECFTLFTSIHSVKKTSEGFNYYINDGVYGSFNCIIFDHASPTPEIWEQSEEPVCKYPSRIFGPTCDSMDCVCELVYLPKLEAGTRLVFRNMGAYTIAASSSFNGFPRPNIYHIE